MKPLVIIFLLVQISHFTSMIQIIHAQKPDVQITNVNNEEDKEQFKAIREIFRDRNPGYDMTYLSGVKHVIAQNNTQVLFIQEIGGITNQDVLAQATVRSISGSIRESEAIVGDILILLKGETIEFNVVMGLLAFTVPNAPENTLPSFIRPDWDPNITDVPGGCATEIDAYRRILLTWKEDVGEYIYHSLNAHRVRMYDSFSHYHPVEGGFDEFYLVQMVKPGARIITSGNMDLITNPDRVDKSLTDGLINEYKLEVGDLVYLPRGVMHRGYGGVLAQVITIPGFIPGSEIGVDHHLKAINERLGLTGDDALPFNEEHSHDAIIR